MATLSRPAIDLTQEQFEQDSLERDRIVGHILATGPARLAAELDRLRKLGLIDEAGNLVRTTLPADMEPGAERDFGG